MSDDENRIEFVRSKLPWITGAAAFVLFAVTLNQWVNMRSLPAAAKVAGWEWGLPVQAPLLYLVTYPIRWFSASVQPLIMNGFTALCAALTLVLLGRSVALLPHDRTHEQRQRERSDYSLLSNSLAWAPVVIAVFVCGLQLTFWEHATAITGEMFDLLIFAYLIRCLLEYRITLEDRWLAKMAFLYGLGVTNNWALIAFFPLFLAAIIWIRGIRFFEPGFLVEMAVLGLLGLLLYLFLPILWTVKHEGDFSFFQIMRANWASQKAFLVDTPVLRNRVFLLSLTSVLPVILMGVRWPSRSGETSAAGAQMSNIAFRVIHLFILGACLYVAFDPKFSPRALGMGVPFLTFYYLGALAIGYYSGYALLVFSDPPRKSWRRDNAALKILNPIIRTLVLGAMVAVPVALARKNLPRVRAQDGSLLHELTVRTAQSLPPGPAYLLSEDIYQLTLLQGHLAGENRAQDYVLINTRLLDSPDYHQLLRKHWNNRWPSLGSREELGSRIGEGDLQRLIFNLASSNTVAYLHPSFGYYFEALYAEPKGGVYPLHPFPPEEVLPPGLAENQIKVNQSFWAEVKNTFEKIRSAKELASPDAAYVSQIYSRGLNDWAVQEQRAGKFPEAGGNFNLAFNLNTNNLPAQLNAQYNDSYVHGKTSSVDINKVLEERFGGVRSWEHILGENGPFDQPDFCAIFGDGLLVQGQYREAALQFSRTVFFQPTNLTARLALAKSYVYGNWVDKGMAEINRIEADFKDRPLKDQADIISLKAAAYYTKKDYKTAEQILTTARTQHPDEDSFTQALFEFYRVSDNYTNALAVANQQLARNPTNVVLLLQKAELQLNNDDTAGAHSTVQEVLKIVPKSGAALLFESFVYIKEANTAQGQGNSTQAQSDYAQAQALLERILQQDSENLQARLYQGITLMEQKQTDKARDAFNKVLEKQPDNFAALRNRAILNLRAQHWSEAKEDYQRLRKLSPKSHAVMYGLGEIAYAQKDYIEATHYYELYLKYAPNDPTGVLQDERKKVEDRLKELKTLTK